jgi:hypothetical protein
VKTNDPRGTVDKQKKLQLGAVDALPKLKLGASAVAPPAKQNSNGSRKILYLLGASGGCILLAGLVFGPVQRMRAQAAAATTEPPAVWGPTTGVVEGEGVGLTPSPETSV